MSKTITGIAVVAAVMIAFVATSLAADAAITIVEEPESILELIKPVLAAFRDGQYMLAGALGVVLLVALMRKYGVRYVPFLGTDAGGVILTFVGALALTVSTGLAVGATMSLGMLWTALLAAVTAAGGYTMVKKLMKPLLPYAPSWLRPMIRVVLWFFDYRSDPVVKEAEEAGDAAVIANPPTGTAGIVGKDRHVP